MAGFQLPLAEDYPLVLDCIAKDSPVLEAWVVVERPPDMRKGSAACCYVRATYPAPGKQVIYSDVEEETALSMEGWGIVESEGP